MDTYELAQKQAERERYLRDMARRIYDTVNDRDVTRRPIEINHIRGIAGPRAGALDVYAGRKTGKLLRLLQADAGALSAQAVPWNFMGQVNTFLNGKSVRIEAGWPERLAEIDIPLSAVVGLDKYNGNKWAQVNGRWMIREGFVLGKDESGRVVAINLNDDVPHILVAGTSGSGKSVTGISIVIQLCADPRNEIIVADGKGGMAWTGREKFIKHSLENLNGLVGPIAKQPNEWRSALIWANQELTRRKNADGAPDTRLIVVLDEIQEIVNSAPENEKAIQRLTTMGRSAGIHVIAMTQYPLIENIGGSTAARNYRGRIVLRLPDTTSSYVAVGSGDPKANMLLGSGDAYGITCRGTHRVQVAYPEYDDIEAVCGQTTKRLTEWPELKTEAIGQQGTTRARDLTSAEIAASLISASEGEGRPAMLKRIVAMNEGQKPGGDLAKYVLSLGRKVLTDLNGAGYAVTPNAYIETIGQIVENLQGKDLGVSDLDLEELKDWLADRVESGGSESSDNNTLEHPHQDRSANDLSFEMYREDNE